MKRFGVGCLVLLLASASVAQEESPESEMAGEVAEPDTQIEEIIVTGTYIGRKDLITPAPVTVITPLDLETSGQILLGDILQMVPFQGNAMNRQVNNEGNGSTRINLRSIGAERTLVLVNGRRHVYGGVGADASVDLTSIPAAIVERVEILKDGASPLYGSDAVGGVVNIITLQDFDGVEASAHTGTSQRGDGVTYDVNVTAGIDFDDGNFLFSAGYTETKPVWAGDRNHSWVQYEVIDWDPNQDPSACEGEMRDGLCVQPVGSYGTERLAIYDSTGASGNAAWQDCQNRYPGNDSWILGEDGCRPFDDTGTTDTNGGDLYNYQPANYLVTPIRSYYAHTQGRRRLGERAQVFFEASYVNRSSRQTLAPYPLLYAPVSADNAYNPYGRDFSMTFRRLTEGGNRTWNQDVGTFRGLLGLDGTLPELLGPLGGWRWELSYQYGRTAATESGSQLVASRVERALGPSFVEDGNVVCGTPGDPDYDCVSVNLFGPPGTISDDMIDYLAYRSTDKGFNELQSLRVLTEGELVELPLDGSLGLAVGYEHREEAGGSRPDPIMAIEGAWDQGQYVQAVTGRFVVNEGLVEANALVAPGLPGIEVLELSGAARLAHYDLFGTNAVWKAGARWQVLEDVALRGTYSTSFRAPTVMSLYAAQIEQPYPDVDICSTMDGPLQGNRAVNCAADGVPEEFLGQNARLLTGGNPELDPETAQVITAGAVYVPRVLGDLSTTVDLWWIRLDDAIATAAWNILNACYDANPGERKLCDMVQRNPVTHEIESLNDLPQNVGRVQTWGIDLGLRYRLGTPIGRFLMSLDGTYLGQHREEILETTAADLAGLSGGMLGVYPRWKANTGVHWSNEGYAVGFLVRFVSSFQECEASCEFLVSDAEVGVLRRPWRRRVPAWAAVDVHASHVMETSWGETQIALGVNNLFDADPPPLYSMYAGSEPGLYDFIGRYFYFRLGHSF